MADNPQEELWFGKYKSREEAERGFRNTIAELDKWKSVASTSQEQMKILQQANEQLRQFQASEPQPGRTREEDLYDDEGRLDVHALQKVIDAKQKPVIEALQRIPDLITEQVRGFFGPIEGSLRAKKEFFGREDVDQRFTDRELEKVLARNPGINKAFEKLLADPETQGSAYEVAYDLWKSTMGKAQPSDNPQRRADKIAASEPIGNSGPPLANEGEPNTKGLMEASQRVQNLGSPDAALAFAREWIKGSKLQSEIEALRPEWAGRDDE